MNKFSASVLAVIRFFSLAAYAQTPTQQDSTKNTEGPNAGRPTQSHQMQKNDMKKTAL